MSSMTMFSICKKLLGLEFYLIMSVMLFTILNYFFFRYESGINALVEIDIK
jgi:hypothetical protein